jgi:23S rRNA (cytidine1920-2'-O)/16S rRNA (cytidine1409-2'-O)-methyltransferase
MRWFVRRRRAVGPRHPCRIPHRGARLPSPEPGEVYARRLRRPDRAGRILQQVRRRLDSELVRLGLVGSRSEAADAIRSGIVTVGGYPARKAGTLVASGDPVAMVGPSARFVSRGGDKLEAALERFALDVTGMHALDAGASTGGFTDVLLRRSVAHVVAVDVGYGQLDWSLRDDGRVTVLERTNVRALTEAMLPYRPDLITADVSFISLRTALPTLVGVSAEPMDAVLLVKPQFEAGREDVGPGGVVRDPDAWARSLHAVASACRALGLSVRGAMASPLTGPAGNVEFLLHARAPAGTSTPSDPDGMVAAAVAEGNERRGTRGGVRA